MSRALMQKWLAGRTIATELAIVQRHGGESQHWEVEEDGELFVQVVLRNHEVPVVALLGALVGGQGRGVWMIPDEGTEVLVALPDGGVAGEAIVVGCLPTRNTPEALSPGKVLIIGAEVLVYDTEAGAAVPLATKADVEALANYTTSHIHLDGTTTPTTGPVENPVIVSPGPPPTYAADPTSAPQPSGTTVLKAE